MLPLEASKLLIAEGVMDDPLMRARVERLRAGVIADEVRTVDDPALSQIIDAELASTPRHGMKADWKSIVILNRFRFDDTEEERERRLESHPALKGNMLNGYGGFDWRDSGSPTYRKKTRAVCQPAWQIHTIVGCHFRCAYCGLGHFQNLLLNMEDYVSRLDGWIAKCPDQTLFQWDNGTDAACFEPELDAARPLIDYFAHQPGRALELYVGKSEHVDFLLDYDHRGHTVCCWSLAGETQSTAFEYRSAPMAARIEAMRRCQEAGYPVRVRFSPIIPVKNWREENSEMIRLLFRDTQPDVVTLETIRFLDYEAISQCFDLSLLDDKFLAAMESASGEEAKFGCQVPDEFRLEVYDHILGELDQHAPTTPVAFCREQRATWEHYAEQLARTGQHPDDYVCNCGPSSAPVSAGKLASA